jgi:hypothetical protein
VIDFAALKYSQFYPDALKLVLLTPTERQFQSARLVTRLLELLPAYSGDPTVLPVPQDAPGEIPRIVLTSPNGTETIQISPARSEFAIGRKPGGTLDVDAFFGSIVNRAETLLTALDSRPYRMAVTGNFYAKAAQPAEALTTQFIDSKWSADDGPMAKVQNFELHIHRQQELLEGLTVNSWLRIKTGRVIDPGGQVPAVVVERDVNTLQEQPGGRTFSPEELTSFVTRARAFLLTELERFFPEQE